MPRPYSKTSYKRVVKLGETPAPLPISVTAPIIEAQRQIQASDLPKFAHGKSLSIMEIRLRIQGLMHRLNYDPIAELMGIATAKLPDGNFAYPLDMRISIHKELAQYIAPKLKATDVQVSGEIEVKVNLVKFSDSGQRIAPNREAIPVRVTEVAS